MDVSVLYDYVGNDEEKRINSFHIIQEYMENPLYVMELIRMVNELGQKDSTVFQLAFLECIRRKWSSDSTFWDENTQSFVIESLLELLFTDNFQDKSHVIESFRFIILSSDYYIIETIKRISDILDSKTHSFKEIANILKIVCFWSKKFAHSDLSIEEQETLLQPIEDLNSTFVKQFCGIADMAASNVSDNDAICCLAYVAKSVSYLSKRSVSILTEDSFPKLIQFFVPILVIECDNEVLVPLKRYSAKLLNGLCSSFLPNSSVCMDDPDGIRKEFSQLFQKEVVPVLLSTTIQCLSMENDEYLMGRLLYLFFQFLHNDLCTEDIVNVDFINNILIPASRLSPNDIYESQTNPEQFIAFNLHYSIKSNITYRTSCAMILKTLVKKFNVLDDLYDLLLAPTVDPVDFEGRIYLMTKFIKETTTQYGPMIEPEVVDALILVTEKVDQKPPFVIASLLNFMRSVLPFLDPAKGVNLSSHCILASKDPIVLITGSKLLSSSIRELEEPIQIDFSGLVKKILELSSHMPSHSLNSAIQGLIKIGGEEVYPLIKYTIDEILHFTDKVFTEEDFASQSEIFANAFSAIADIATALSANQESLQELALQILPRVSMFFQNNPHNSVFSEMFYLVTIFNTKLFQTVNEQYETCTNLINFIIEDSVLTSLVSQVSIMICPLIVNNSSGSGSIKNVFLTKCMDLYNHFVNYCLSSKESDISDKAHTLLIASSLIQAIGEPALVYVPHAVESLLSDKGKDIAVLFSASVMTITSAFVCDYHQTQSMLDDSVMSYLLADIKEKNLPTYKELRLGFILLLFLVKCGKKSAYRASVNLLPALIKLKEEDDLVSEDDLDISHELSMASLIIPFDLPIDSFDEFAFFGEITDQTGLFNALTAKEKRIVKQYFQM